MNRSSTFHRIAHAAPVVCAACLVVFVSLYAGCSSTTPCPGRGPCQMQPGEENLAPPASPPTR